MVSCSARFIQLNKAKWSSSAHLLLSCILTAPNKIRYSTSYTAPLIDNLVTPRSYNGISDRLCDNINGAIAASTMNIPISNSPHNEYRHIVIKIDMY